MPGRSRDRKRYPRQPTTAADVDDAQRARVRQVLQRRERVEHMVSHHALGLPDRRQVVRAVPLFEHCDVRQQFRARCRVEIEAERFDAAGERPTEPHAVSFSEPGCASLNPRLR